MSDAYFKMPAVRHNHCLFVGEQQFLISDFEAKLLIFTEI